MFLEIKTMVERNRFYWKMKLEKKKRNQDLQEKKGY